MSLEKGEGKPGKMGSLGRKGGKEEGENWCRKKEMRRKNRRACRQEREGKAGKEKLGGWMRACWRWEWICGVL